ncbi:MAG: hypothetical protein A3A22_00715 [Candidatus Taylorbacteria bacterium RIFCSPLOWO2_01_FULL_45_34b]|nr:MAG: hypothetical protein A3A22_00715 [Candidatus Taylorbacteria bacterium RIFCSPLOWO2_01_FULL_45_34b]
MTETVSSGKIAFCQEYVEAEYRFKVVRTEARRLRRQLITAVLYDEKELLTEQELAVVISLMDRFLEVQVRLRQAYLAKNKLSSEDGLAKLLTMDFGEDFATDGKS